MKYLCSWKIHCSWHFAPHHADNCDVAVMSWAALFIILLLLYTIKTITNCFKSLYPKFISNYHHLQNRKLCYTHLSQLPMVFNGSVIIGRIQTHQLHFYFTLWKYLFQLWSQKCFFLLLFFQTAVLVSNSESNCLDAFSSNCQLRPTSCNRFQEQQCRWRIVKSDIQYCMHSFPPAAHMTHSCNDVVFVPFWGMCYRV